MFSGLLNLASTSILWDNYLFLCKLRLVIANRHLCSFDTWTLLAPGLTRALANNAWWFWCFSGKNVSTFWERSCGRSFSGQFCRIMAFYGSCNKKIFICGTGHGTWVSIFERNFFSKDFQTYHLDLENVWEEEYNYNCISILIEFQ